MLWNQRPRKEHHAGNTTEKNWPPFAVQLVSESRASKPKTDLGKHPAHITNVVRCPTVQPLVKLCRPVEHCRHVFGAARFPAVDVLVESKFGLRTRLALPVRRLEHGEEGSDRRRPPRAN